VTADETSGTQKRPDTTIAMNRMKEQIEAIAQEEAKEMIQEAKGRAEEIIENAKKEATVIKKQILDEARNEAEKEKVREISRKKLGLKMDYLETREAVIEELVVEAQSELQKFTKSKKYPSFLNDLVQTSGISIGGGDLLVELRKEDKAHFSKESLSKIAKDISKITGVDTDLKVADNDLNALGGIRVVRSDGSLFVDNTFEQRLIRSEEKTRVELLDVLS